MKKLKRIGAALIVMFAVTGCSYISTLSPTRVVSYIIDSSVLMSSLVNMNDVVRDARASVNANKASFTAVEWRKIESAGDQIDHIKNRFDLLFGNDAGIGTRIVGRLQLRSLVRDVFDTYDSVEAIVLLHADRFDGTQRLQVLKAKTTMDDLKRSYDAIEVAADANVDPLTPTNATNTIQQALFTVIKIAAVFTK